MPCTRCNRAGHNRRNLYCPVKIAERSQTRPPAELRPRGYVSQSHRRNRESLHNQTIPIRSSMAQFMVDIDVLEDYLLMYRNTRPFRQIRMNSVDIYNMYYLSMGPSMRIIHSSYILANTDTVVTRTIRGNYITGLAVHDGNAVQLLNNVPYPTNTDLFILIPQVPGFNTTIGLLPPADDSSTMQSIRSPAEIREELFTKYVTSIELIVRPVDVDMHNKADDCCVCLTAKPISEFVHMNCEHQYCAVCVQQHILSHKNKCTRSNMDIDSLSTIHIPCPLCRSNISKLIFANETESKSMAIFMKNV